ncbi:MAG: hypothetical protein ACKOW3_02085 [Hyphomicrobium sp.]
MTVKSFYTSYLIAVFLSTVLMGTALAHSLSSVIAQDVSSDIVTVVALAD